MAEATYEPRLKKFYAESVRAKLIEEFAYANPMQVPALDKIVLNMGVGEAVGDTKKVQVAAADLAAIAGQKPVITRAARLRSSPRRCLSCSRLPQPFCMVTTGQRQPSRAAISATATAVS